MLLKGNVPDVIEKREHWKTDISEYDINHLVFLDESGVNTNMSRIYGRAVGGNRTEDKIPLTRSKNTTILSSVRLNGETAYTIYQGGTTKEKFTTYLKDVLIPTLHEGDVVIMDNMRTHCSNEVKKVFNDANISFLYLPPYSPDFNPIEKMWSKVKSILRMLKEREPSLLSSAIHKAFQKISPSDCIGWFGSCGLFL